MDGRARGLGVSFPCTVIALDVGGTKIAAALARYDARDERPTLGGYCTVATSAAEGGDALLSRIVALASEMAGEVPPDAPLVGVGVSAAGSIDEETGRVAYANEIIPGWTGQPLGEALERSLGVPAAVLNDVRGYALGELRHGAARGSEICIVVAAGTGLGGALIVDGKVLNGSRGFAGMVGHTLHPAAVGKPSAWGTTGHLESVASGSGIEACYRLAGGDALSGPEISARAVAGEELARSVVEQAGRSLGEAIASWADLLDPDLVVVGGSVCSAGPLWRAALESGLQDRLVAELKDLKVVEAELGRQAPLIGAAERLLDRLTVS